MQVSTSQILSVLFFPPHDIPNKAAFVSNFIEYTKVFDADPMILPMTNAPPPVPRVVLKSRDERFACEVALDRLNFVYNDTLNQRRSLDSLYPEYREILHHVVLGALAGFNVPILRLGFVTRHVVATGDGANEWFCQTYLRPDRLPAAYETHLNMLHRFEMDSFQVNRWIKLWTLRDQADAAHDPAVAVEIDINTFPENTTPFDRAAILSFYLEGFDRAGKDLKAYVLDFLGEAV